MVPTYHWWHNSSLMVKAIPHNTFPLITTWVSPGAVETCCWSSSWQAGYRAASGKQAVEWSCQSRPSAVQKTKASKALCNARFYLMSDCLQETSTVMRERCKELVGKSLLGERLTTILCQEKLSGQPLWIPKVEYILLWGLLFWEKKSMSNCFSCII